MRVARAAVLAALLPLAACSLGEDDNPHAALRDVIGSDGGSDFQGRSVSITVPGLRYDLLVGGPLAEIDELDAEELGIDHRADDGTAFLTVHWTIAKQPGDTFVYERKQGVDVELDLLVDGEEYAVGELDAQDGAQAYYVVVPDDIELSDVGLELTYDGRTQSVESMTGIGDSDLDHLLNRDAPRRYEQTCDQGPVETPKVRVSPLGCTVVGTSPLSYHGDLGWAPTGRAWVVVDVSVGDVYYLDSPRYPDADYDVTTGDAVVTLDGERAVDELPVDQQAAADGEWYRRLVFEVDETALDGTLEIKRVFRGEPHSDPWSEGAQRLTWTFERTVHLG